jgi:hypothetical protein
MCAPRDCAEAAVSLPCGQMNQGRVCSFEAVMVECEGVGRREGEQGRKRSVGRDKR